MMKTISMLEFRKNAEGILRRIRRRERFVLSHRGKPAAHLGPVTPLEGDSDENDPFLTIAERAVPSPKGKTRHDDIDIILYGDA